jgi:hypothetical protein
MQDNTCMYPSLSRLSDAALGLENAGCRTWNTVLITNPHLIFSWNSSQLAYPWLVSCLFHVSTYARIIGALPLFTAPRVPLRSFIKKRVLVQLHELFWYAAASASLYRIDKGLPKRRVRLHVGA